MTDITVIGLASYLMNKNIGSNRELLKQLAWETSIDIGVLDRVMNASEDYQLPFHILRKIIRAFGFEIKQLPRGHRLSLNLNTKEKLC